MTEIDAEFDSDLEDDLAGLRDAIEILDWPGALAISLEIEKNAPKSGWPVLGDLAASLSASLRADNADVVPADAIEVLVNTMVLCVADSRRKFEDLDPELVLALQAMKERYSF